LRWKWYEPLIEIETQKEITFFDGAVFGLIACEGDAAGMAVMLMFVKAVLCQVMQRKHLHGQKNNGKCEAEFSHL